MSKEIDERDYLAEFLAAGGTVQKIPQGQKSDQQTIQKFWGGRPKKKTEEVIEVKEKKPRKTKAKK
jgi:hypothetical protein